MKEELVDQGGFRENESPIPARPFRFWVWNDGWVMLKLKPGQVLRHHVSEYTEEGHFSQTDRWEFIAEDCTIEHAVQTNSRDCDGRMDTFHRESSYKWSTPQPVVPPVVERRRRFRSGDNPAPGPRLVWRDISSSQRDHAAEAMGY